MTCLTGNADALRRRRSTLTDEEKEDARLKNTAARRKHRALLTREGSATVRAKDIASTYSLKSCGHPANNN